MLKKCPIFCEVVVPTKRMKKSNKHGSGNAYFLRYVHLSIVADDVWLRVRLRDRQVNIEETNTVWSQSFPKGRGMHCYGRTSR